MQGPIEELVPELTGYASGFLVCMALLICVYNEDTFRQFPRLHIVMSGLVILTIFSTDVALTLFFKESSLPESEQHYNIKVRNEGNS